VILFVMYQDYQYQVTPRPEFCSKSLGPLQVSHSRLSYTTILDRRLLCRHACGRL